MFPVLLLARVNSSGPVQKSLKRLYQTIQKGFCTGIKDAVKVYSHRLGNKNQTQHK